MDETKTIEITSTITQLEPETTYYIRAYATNSVGTSYGEEYTDTTLPPTISASKTVIQYNSNGSISEEDNFAMYSNSKDWINFSKITYTYDSNKHKTMSIYSIWDKSVKNWINNTKETFSFFAFEQMWSGIYYGWNVQNNKWYVYRKREYDKDIKYNNILYEYDYTFNTSTYKWTYETKYRFILKLDTQGRIYQFTSNEWRELYNDYYSITGITYIYYDSNGYEVGTSSPNNGTSLDITYDNNKNPIQKIYSRWSSDLSKYVEISKTVYTYDSYGKLNEYIEYIN